MTLCAQLVAMSLFEAAGPAAVRDAQRERALLEAPDLGSLFAETPVSLEDDQLDELRTEALRGRR